MSLDPNKEKEILVTPQPRTSPQIGWRERIEKGKEEAKESLDDITEANLSAAEEEEEEGHSEAI